MESNQINSWHLIHVLLLSFCNLSRIALDKLGIEAQYLIIFNKGIYFILAYFVSNSQIIQFFPTAAVQFGQPCNINLSVSLTFWIYFFNFITNWCRNLVEIDLIFSSLMLFLLYQGSHR